jgi:group I intron endonuclease
MKGVIYCYHCIPTGKKYIGQTVYEERRKRRHKEDCGKGVNNKFYRAVRKYGWDNFIYGIIDEYDTCFLNEQEIFYVDKYDTYHNGYNSTIGGAGCRGFTPSEETKKKQSIAAKNRTDVRPNQKYFTEEEKREAKRKRDRKYQQKIKERRKEYMKEWREKNLDYLKEYREKNKEKIKQGRKEHREKNKEKRNEYNKWYYHNVVKPLKKSKKKIQNNENEKDT